MTGRVLIVDDVPANRQLLADLLRRQGYDLETAATGDEALAAVERNPPDVILLDVVLPGISGFDVCQQLKSDPATRLIPVVL
ncbi:MAG TPA: response regulator, partial [Vicinamibacterales bacterium]|nr:response regulator [Vicinamibacterales bacterium]